MEESNPTRCSDDSGIYAEKSPLRFPDSGLVRIQFADGACERRKSGLVWRCGNVAKNRSAANYGDLSSFLIKGKIQIQFKFETPDN
jgi:hypothetical protein